MKNLLLIVTICSFAAVAQAAQDHKTHQRPGTKYICSLGGSISTITEEFATKEECEKACFHKDLPAVCEETGVATHIEE